MIYRRNTVGAYVTAGSVASIFERETEAFESLELFELTDNRKILLGSGLRSVVETANNTWSVVQPIENPDGFLSSKWVHDGQLFLHFKTRNRPVLDYIRVYELDADSRKWVQTQTLNFHNSAFVGHFNRLKSDGDRLSVVRSKQNVEDVRLMMATVSLFEKDDTNQWQLVFEQEFTGPEPNQPGGRDYTSSSFAGNNQFLSTVENEVINIRCGPVQANNNGPEGNANSCDYTDAALYGGWGWDATTSQSCAPLDNVINTPPTTQCVDTDGDGWGWDGTATCTLEAATNTGADSDCDYSDAHLYGGWGWNAAASQCCAHLETVSNDESATQCIDTDGDGWDWNGSMSCIP